jgi:hypothetical protein
VKKSDLAKKTIATLSSTLDELSRLDSKLVEKEVFAKKLSELVSLLANMDLYRQDANHFRQVLANYHLSGNSSADRKEAINWLSDRLSLYKLLDFKELDTTIAFDWPQLWFAVCASIATGLLVSSVDPWNCLVFLVGILILLFLVLYTLNKTR